MSKFNTWLVVPVVDADECGSFETVEEAVDFLRSCWQEDQRPDGTFGPAVYVIQALDGTVEATLMRGETPESCMTVYRDGRLERHDCRYIMGPDGMFDRCEVTEASPRGWATV